MNDSKGREIKPGKPFTIYRHDAFADLKEIRARQKENVNNLTLWFAEQDEKYLLEVFSRLPKEAKAKLMKVLTTEPITKEQK